MRLAVSATSMALFLALSFFGFLCAVVKGCNDNVYEWEGDDDDDYD